MFNYIMIKTLILVLAAIEMIIMITISIIVITYKIGLFTGVTELKII